MSRFANKVWNIEWLCDSCWAVCAAASPCFYCSFQPQPVALGYVFDSPPARHSTHGPDGLYYSWTAPRRYVPVAIAYFSSIEGVRDETFGVACGALALSGARPLT